MHGGCTVSPGLLNILILHRRTYRGIQKQRLMCLLQILCSSIKWKASSGNELFSHIISDIQGEKRGNNYMVLKSVFQFLGSFVHLFKKLLFFYLFLSLLYNNFLNLSLGCRGWHFCYFSVPRLEERMFIRSTNIYKK